MSLTDRGKLSPASEAQIQRLRASAWNKVCHHIDGIAIGSTVHALERNGFLTGYLPTVFHLKIPPVPPFPTGGTLALTLEHFHLQLGLSVMMFGWTLRPLPKNWARGPVTFI